MSEAPTEQTKLIKDPYKQQTPEELYTKSWKDLLDAPKDFWTLVAIKLFSYTSIYTFSISVAIYVTEVKDESDKFLSTIYALMGLGGIILIVVLGNISDRYGTKKTLIAGSILLISKFLLLFAFENIYLQILFFLVPGAFASILINPTIESGIKQSTAKNYRTLAISLYWSITALASMFAGFAISIFIIFGDKTQSTFNLLFLFCAGMGGVGFILALFLEGPKSQNLTEEEIRLKEQKKLTAWEHTRQVLILKNFWRLVCVILMITAIRTVFFHQTIALPLYMERDLGDDSLYGAMLVLNQVIIISTTPLFSYSVYYFSEYQIFIISGLIAIISPLCFIFGATYTTVTGFIVLTSIGESLLLPRILEYSLNVAPKGKEGVIITISSLPLLLCYIIAGIIGSLLLDSYCPSEGDRECWKMWIIISIVAVPPTFILIFCKKWLEDKDFESNPFISCSKESKYR